MVHVGEHLAGHRPGVNGARCTGRCAGGRMMPTWRDERIMSVHVIVSYRRFG